MGGSFWRVGQGNRGVALLVVLLITGLATVLAVALVSSQQVQIRRTANILNSGQAFWLARGVEDFAIQVLIKDGKDGNTDHLNEGWAQLGEGGEAFSEKVEDGEVSGRLEDLQGRVNLNNLFRLMPTGTPPKSDVASIQSITRKRLERLLQHCEVDPEVALAVEDWIDEDIEPQFPAGAEDEAYSGVTPSYRTANRRMASSSELRLVKGITPEAFRCLEPLVCALPDGSSINVNTAPAKVLAALVDEEKFGLTAAQDLVKDRGKGYDSVAAFRNAAKLQTNDLDETSLDVKSQYFLAHINVQVGNGTVYLESMLYRKDGQVKVIRRTLGVQ